MTERCKDCNAIWKPNADGACSFCGNRSRIISVVVNETVHVTDSVNVKFPDLPAKSIKGKLLTPMDFEPGVEPYLIEIKPGKKLAAHFFSHKGEEMGYLLSGTLTLSTGKNLYSAKSGDVIYLKNDLPSQWENTGKETAKLFWIKMN